MSTRRSTSVRRRGKARATANKTAGDAVVSARGPKTKPRRPPTKAAPKQPTISVDITNQQEIVAIPARHVRSAVRHVLLAEGQRQGTMGVLLTTDAVIQALHEEFLGQDTATDVLTFPLSEPGEPITAEIVISVETAARVAARHGMTPQAELLLYLVHGLLHLCGYDDHDAKQARRMHTRQKKLLHDILGHQT